MQVNIVIFCLATVAVVTLVSSSSVAVVATSISEPLIPHECVDTDLLVASLFQQQQHEEEHEQQDDCGSSSSSNDHANRRWNNTPASFCHPDLPDFDLSKRIFKPIKRVNFFDVDRARFLAEFHEKEPVVFVAPPNRSRVFAELTQRSILLKCFGHLDILMSTANEYSVEKTRTTLRDYIENYVRPQNLSLSGFETKYLFGPPTEADFTPLLKHYVQPTEQLFDAGARGTALSFGIAATGTGVPLHGHGHVFSEQIHGAKRWFFSPPPPAEEPRHEPNMSVLKWLLDVQPTYSQEENDAISETIVYPGEILYIPSFWRHSTFNLGEAVFISTFL